METNEIQFTTEGGSYINSMSQPLQLTWRPKEDITTYELACSIIFLFGNRAIMPNEFDSSAPYARHFEVNDPNN